MSHRRASHGPEDRWTLKLSIPSRKKKGESQRGEVHVPGRGLYPPPHPRTPAGSGAASRAQADRHQHHRSTSRRAGRPGADGAGRAPRRSRLLHAPRGVRVRVRGLSKSGAGVVAASPAVAGFGCSRSDRRSRVTVSSSVQAVEELTRAFEQRGCVRIVRRERAVGEQMAETRAATPAMGGAAPREQS